MAKANNVIVNFAAIEADITSGNRVTTKDLAKAYMVSPVTLRKMLADHLAPASPSSVGARVASCWMGRMRLRLRRSSRLRRSPTAWTEISFQSETPNLKWFGVFFMFFDNLGRFCECEMV